MENVQRYGSQSFELIRRYPLISLVFFGVLFRILLLPFVKVSADTSLYTYDALLVLEGWTPIVDYPTRSPLFSYLYAVPLTLGGSGLVTARITMLVASAIIGVAVFQLARILHSRRAAIAATFIYFATPLSVVYGQLLYTEQVTQLFVIAAVILLYRNLDIENPSYIITFSIGVLCGAAFLIRRVVIVQVGVIGLFLLFYCNYHKNQQFSKTVMHELILIGGVTITLAVGYIGLAWPSFDDALLIAEQQIVWLFRGSPVGNVAWVEMGKFPLTDNPTSLISGFPSIRTVLIKLTHLFAVAMPVALPFISMVRSYVWTRPLPKWTDTLIGVGFAMTFLIGGISRWILYPAGTLRAPLVGIIGAAAVTYLWLDEPIDLRNIWNPQYFLLLGFGILVIVGYFSLGNLGFVHFLDVLPYLTVFSGILTVELISHREALQSLTIHRIGAVILLLTIVVGLLSATALVTDTGIGGGIGDSLDTMTEVDAVNEDMASRLENRRSVLVAQPMYIIESGTRQAANLSRGYWIILHAPNSSTAHRLQNRLRSRINDGSVQYMITDKWTRFMLNNSPTVKQAVKKNFCPVKDDDLYEATGADLYVRSKSAPQCSHDINAS